MEGARLRLHVDGCVLNAHLPNAIRFCGWAVVAEDLSVIDAGFAKNITSIAAEAIAATKAFEYLLRTEASGVVYTDSAIVLDFLDRGIGGGRGAAAQLHRARTLFRTLNGRVRVAKVPSKQNLAHDEAGRQAARLAEDVSYDARLRGWTPELLD